MGKITTHPCNWSQEGIGGIEELLRSNIQTILWPHLTLDTTTTCLHAFKHPNRFQHDHYWAVQKYTQWMSLCNIFWQRFWLKYLRLQRVRIEPTASIFCRNMILFIRTLACNVVWGCGWILAWLNMANLYSTVHQNIHGPTAIKTIRGVEIIPNISYLMPTRTSWGMPCQVFFVSGPG